MYTAIYPVFKFSSKARKTFINCCRII